ncbi:hypothetical protein HRG_014322 [Hirsutella rhossiliensis]
MKKFLWSCCSDHSDRESKPPQDINVLLQAPYMPIRERTPKSTGQTAASGDDGYGNGRDDFNGTRLRHIEENGDTYEAGTRMQRAYQQAGRQTPVSDDDDQPMKRIRRSALEEGGLL